MKIYAYGRVSTEGQKLDRQVNEFIEYGVERKNIFCDKLSGKDFERENYKRMVKKLRKGDLLVIKSIDRLGRNYYAIIDEWKKITAEAGADIVVLDMPILDTRSTDGNLAGRLVSDLVLQILSFVAQNERETIKKRQAEGIRIAKERGVRLGRPNNELPKEFIALAAAYRKGDMALQTVLERLQMKKSTFYRHCGRFVS